MNRAWRRVPVVILAVTCGPPHRTAHAAPAVPQDCFAELEQGTGDTIACAFPLRLSPQEQAELKAGSRGYVENVSCTLSVTIARAAINTAIQAAEHIFQSPDQPVTCTVTTSKSAFDITATFAPRVVFKNDEAVEASPGLGNVKGITRVISWPVVQFVNRWPSIRSGMLQVVNAYRTHARKRLTR